MYKIRQGVYWRFRSGRILGFQHRTGLEFHQTAINKRALDFDVNYIGLRTHV